MDVRRSYLEFQSFTRFLLITVSTRSVSSRRQSAAERDILRYGNNQCLEVFGIVDEVFFADNVHEGAH